MITTFESFVSVATGVPVLVRQVLARKPYCYMDVKNVLNNGFCSPFANAVLKLAREAGVEAKKLSTPDFQKELEDPKGAWNVPLDNGFEGYYWNAKALEKFGAPPVDKALSEFHLDYHAWAFANGKHYDAEAPDGVDSPWQLPFFVDAIRLHNRRHANKE